MSLGKRGPLPSVGSAPARSNYKCLVPECNCEIRGDKLRSHYVSKVDFQILAQIKHSPAEIALQTIESLNPEDKKFHTKHFYNNNIFDMDGIPSYKNHKRPLAKLKTPFDRCKSVSKGIYKNLFSKC